MHTTRKHLPSVLLAIALLFGVPAPAQESQPAAGTEHTQPVFKPEELEQMLAPIALYPDALLAQILMAATYPLEIVQADRWVKQPEHKDLKGEQLAQALDTETWDPSVKSLAPFPQILHMMSDKLDWTQRLGDAVLAQRKDVLEAVQSLRKRAEAAGTLATTEQQQVVVQDQAVAIKPADPEKVYVPVYNSSVVYGPWPYPAYPPPYYPPPPAYAPVGSALMSGIGSPPGLPLSAPFGAGATVTGAVTTSASTITPIIPSTGRTSQQAARPGWHRPAARPGNSSRAIAVAWPIAIPLRGKPTSARISEPPPGGNTIVATPTFRLGPNALPDRRCTGHDRPTEPSTDSRHPPADRPPHSAACRRDAR